jgi:hypothetical protein
MSNRANTDLARLAEGHSSTHAEGVSTRRAGPMGGARDARLPMPSSSLLSPAARGQPFPRSGAGPYGLC